MRLLTVLAILTLLGLADPVRADKVGPPGTYKVLSANERFVFVMIAPEPAEQELRRYNEDHQKVVKAIRDAYPRSGLYKNGSDKPLWTVDWHSPAVRVANDGVHVVRYGRAASLEQRRKTPNRTITQKDLKQEAVSIIARGKLLLEYSIGELVDDPKQLPMTVSHFRWAKQIRILDDKKQLEVVTLDRNRILIDLKTAKIVEKKKAE
jgi:hypothetical protein